MSHSRPRRAAPFHAPLGSRLGSYSAGALTGALSIASSDAAIVYVNPTPDRFMDDPVKNDFFFASHDVDLNSDSVVDLRLWTKDSTNVTPPDLPTDNDAIIVGPLGLPVTVVGQNVAGYNYVSRLSAGAVIDASANLITLNDPPDGPTVGWMADSNGFPNSQFVAAPNNTGYVGVRFVIAGQNHFGWMRLTVNPQGMAGANPRAITLHEWAYESTPNAGITTGAIPEPATTSLGLLALGSVGLSLHRRRRPRSDASSPMPQGNENGIDQSPAKS
jgi:hypothetical protein